MSDVAVYAVTVAADGSLEDKPVRFVARNRTHCADPIPLGELAGETAEEWLHDVVFPRVASCAPFCALGLPQQDGPAAVHPFRQPLLVSELVCVLEQAEQQVSHLLFLTLLVLVVVVGRLLVFALVLLFSFVYLRQNGVYLRGLSNLPPKPRLAVHLVFVSQVDLVLLANLAYQHIPRCHARILPLLNLLTHIVGVELPTRVVAPLPGSYLHCFEMQRVLHWST